ncbi:PleD family two-component system response regulator [Pedobacter sp. SYP-B3415]|uniref:response regulator n=1 Tax=Pedobacter sp. SYP-B3415 TaxID=2496641 RepID=UPI00101DD4FE|nr:response regulator [Pedobacter sp. SYP-B3415]
MTVKKVLVCDDDEAILDVTTLVLEDSGYEVTPVIESTQIYDVIRQVKPDLLLLDLWMPDLSGEDITRFVKSDAELQNIPIIIISASSEGRRIAEEIKADGFLPKPFDIDGLIEMVARYTA